MFHPNTLKLMDYWTGRAAPGRAPSRAAIQPADFRQLMPQTFILGREAKGRYPMRLAGGLIADLHRRDLRLVNGLMLWSERDRLRVQTALEDIRRRAEPLVVVAEALADGASLPLEVLLAPLVAHDDGPDRFLGLYQPLAMAQRLQGRPVLELAVRSMHRAGAAEDTAPHIRLAAVGGRRIA